jgi:hypothetical protein
MSRLGILVSAFLAGVAAALLALYVALRTAPGVIMADDMVDALLAVADTPLREFPRDSIVYVQSPVGEVLLEKLQPRYPFLRLMSYSARPEENGCETAPDARRVTCKHDDFVKLEVLSSPTRGTMLVAVGTGRAFGQVLLLRFLGRWRVIVYRSYMI